MRKFFTRSCASGDSPVWNPAAEALVIRPKSDWTVKRSFGGEQIIGLIKAYQADVKAQKLFRRYGVSDATLLKRKAGFDGLDLSDTKKLRALDGEHNGLKRILADAMLDNTALKDFATKVYSRPTQRVGLCRT